VEETLGLMPFCLTIHSKDALQNSDTEYIDFCQSVPSFSLLKRKKQRSQDPDEKKKGKNASSVISTQYRVLM